MLIRALIVLLVALNLGAAAWWITRPAAAPAPPLPEMPTGAARLQLLSEVTPSRIPAATQAPAPEQPTAAPPRAIAASEQAQPAQCFSLGPFADAPAAEAAVVRLGEQASRLRTREVPGRGASAYNVFLPPLDDRAAAQALAQRIGAAGFDDFLVLNSGEQANGIALGRYGSREGAERRQSALQAAGFPAQLQVVGKEGAAQWWLDLAASPGVDGPRLKTLASAAQSRPLDCAALR